MGHTRLRHLALWAGLLFAGSGCSYMTVQSGELGVIWTTDGVTDKVYPPGEYHIGVYDRPTVYSSRSQEREERLEVLAANGLRIILEASIRYHIDPSQVVALDRELGVHYYSVLIGPSLRSQSRRVVGRYQPEEIYSTQREAIEREIRDGIEKVINGRHVQLEAVLIRNVILPESIQSAINNKLEVEQQSLKMKYVIERTKQEAEEQLIQAKAEAERETVHAKAEADAKRVAAQATDDYVRLVQAHLTDQVLKWQQIQALGELAKSPNAKVILMGNDGKSSSNILDIK